MQKYAPILGRISLEVSYSYGFSLTHINHNNALVYIVAMVSLRNFALLHYAVIQKAISANRRVLYTEVPDPATQNRKTKKFLFAPKCIYQTDGRFYMLGYNSTYKRKMAVDLSVIATIKLANKRKNPHVGLARQCLNDCTPEQLIAMSKELRCFLTRAINKNMPWTNLAHGICSFGGHLILFCA